MLIISRLCTSDDAPYILHILTMIKSKGFILLVMCICSCFKFAYSVVDVFCQADSGKLGSSDSSQILLVADGELEGDDCLGQVPETYWAVPQITSPPTASGLYWPRSFQDPPESAVFVPDISSSLSQNQSKRRRNF